LSWAIARIPSSKMAIVPGAGHLLEEAGAIDDELAQQAA